MIGDEIVKGSGREPGIVVGRFTLDGTSNPSVLSEELESVTRFEADTSSYDLYRVKFKRNYAPGRNRKYQHASIEHDGSARRSCEIVTSALLSTVAADQDLEVDVGVVTGGALSITLDGPVVSVLIYLDNHR